MPHIGASGLSDLYTSVTKSLLAQSPGIKTIEAQLNRDSSRLSTIGKLALALDQFRASANRLSGDKLDVAASVTGKSVSAQITDSKASAGTHKVEVKQLAQGQQLATRALPDKAAALGTGAATVIKIDIGTGSGAKSTTLRIENGNNTLDGIAKAMRDAGLDAKVLPDGKGYSIILTGPVGAANTMRISVAGDPVLQGLLSYGPGVKSAMTSKAAPQDAQLTVDGKAVTSPTNTVGSAIPGLSLTLNQTGASEIKVARDPSATAGNLKDFVSAFNTLETSLRALKTGDGANDAMVARMQSQIGQILDGGDPRALAAMGITRKSDGLTLDEAKLSQAIAADPDKVAQMFGAPGTGLAHRLSTHISEQMTKGGMLANQAAAVRNDVDKLAAKKTQITETINRQASMLVKQYEQAGAGGSSMFGPSAGAKPMSLFDILT